jgi:hypothetical protein
MLAQVPQQAAVPPGDSGKLAAGYNLTKIF